MRKNNREANKEALKELDYQRENGEKLNKQYELLSNEIDSLQKIRAEGQRAELNKFFSKYKGISWERQKELLEEKYR